jgi:hypothetical protein
MEYRCLSRIEESPKIFTDTRNQMINVFHVAQRTATNQFRRQRSRPLETLFRNDMAHDQLGQICGLTQPPIQRLRTRSGIFVSCPRHLHKLLKYPEALRPSVGEEGFVILCAVDESIQQLETRCELVESNLE